MATGDTPLAEPDPISHTSEASALMNTLDKLESFKRYSLALAFLALDAGALFLFGLIIAALVYKGQSDQAVDAAKWMLTLIGTPVGIIVGFYFGSNTAGKTA